MDILTSTIVLPVIGAFFAAAFVKGVTGLGFSTTCLALLLLFIDLKAALPLVLVPSLFSNVIVMRQAGHFKETISTFWPLYLAAVPGIFAGLAILVWVDEALATAVLGSVLILYGLFTLVSPGGQLPNHWQRPLNPFVGVVTGTINGLTGSQVMPVLPYMMSLGLDKKRFTQALNCCFSLCSIMMAIGLARHEILSVSALTLSVLCLIPIYLGVRFGTALQDKLSEKSFKRIVLIVLIFLGAGMVLKPVLGLLPQMSGL